MSGLLEMTTISSGTYEMGCTESQAEHCDDEERPPHMVTLSNSILVANNETTQALFASVLGINPSGHADCEECPVENVTWDDAASFCNGLSDTTGLSNCYTCGISGCSRVEDFLSCDGYRLPTEAEWEFFARCRTDLIYSGDDDAFNVAWTRASSGDTTHPVGQLNPNDCGLYDVSGNVWEWVEDMFAPYQSEAVTDPIGVGNIRVVRGGGYNVDPSYSRVSNRRDFPEVSEENVGFRVVRTLSGGTR
jgi:formylglycine-generating enzyme required for sulfatase activity